VGAIGLLVVSGLLDGIWACPLKRITGLPCPGCGMTRAVRLVLRGDFAAATHMHPLVWLVLPMLCLFALAELRGYVLERAWGTAMNGVAAKAMFGATVALLASVWTARFFGAFGGPVP
jgi:hypothetical protein